MPHSSYMDRAFSRRSEIVSEADKLLRAVDFNTFVGTGLSGTLVAPLLADMCNGTHNFAIVRKGDDRSTHSYHRIEGELTPKGRFVFVDDLIQSGDTLLRVLETIVSEFSDCHESFLPKMVGVFLYESYQFISTDNLIRKYERYGGLFSNKELLELLRKFA